MRRSLISGLNGSPPALYSTRLSHSNSWHFIVVRGSNLLWWHVSTKTSYKTSNTTKFQMQLISKEVKHLNINKNWNLEQKKIQYAHVFNIQRKISSPKSIHQNICE